MPSYLNEASRLFKRARQADDPISKLEFYLPSASSSSSSCVSSSSGPPSFRDLLKSKFKSRRVKPAACEASNLWTGSSASSCYSVRLARLMNGANGTCTNRPEAVNPALRKRQVRTPPSSDFSSQAGCENLTLTERTSIAEYFGRQPDLENCNYLSSWRRQNRHQPPVYRVKAALSGPDWKRSPSDQLDSGQGKQLSAVSKLGQLAAGGQKVPSKVNRRRKKNRRHQQLVGDEIDELLIDPYALSELFSQSEIPGFREIFASDSYLRKFCWIVAFLVMTVLSLRDTTELITEYFDYPITVDVRHRDSARLPFPAVTVCNLNAVRFTALCGSSLDLVDKIPSEIREKLCGIQVEKNKNKNQTGDSDISDINNIGITTTTGSPANSSAYPSSTNDEMSLSTISPISPTSSMDPQDELNRGRQQSSTPATSDGGGGDGLTTKAATSTTSRATTSTSASPTTKRSSTVGIGLDLGDFTVQPLPLVDQRQSIKRDRWRRSFRLGRGQDADRPFSSARAPVQVGPVKREREEEKKGEREEKEEAAEQLSKSAQRPTQLERLNSAGQFNKQNVNLQASRSGSNPSPNSLGGIRNVPPAFGVSPNSIGGPQNGAPSGQSTYSVSNHQPTPPGNVNGPSSHVFPVPGMQPPNLPDDYELTERQERELHENLTNWLAVMHNRDPELTENLGHQFDDMLLRCTMKSINCTHQRNFQRSFSATEGNCFTYKSLTKRSGSSSIYEEANLAGTSQGLELVLNLEKNEYIPGSSQVGALVMVHHPSELGYVASEATFVAPEYTTYIGLKMVNISRLPDPFPEHCVDSWPTKFADTLTRNSTYSQQACLKICLQKTIHTLCQCQSAFLPLIELEGPTSSNPNTVPGVQASSSNSSGQQQQQQQQQKMQLQQRIIICDTRKRSTRRCVREVTLRAADRVHNCQCPPKCQVVRYDKTISMARWPTSEDKITFDRGKLDINFQNLAKVIVYFQTMTCEEITQQEVYNAAKLFSSLGGIMGMYVGFSFLSVFEIFEVMSRKIWHHYTLKLTRRRA